MSLYRPATLIERTRAALHILTGRDVLKALGDSNSESRLMEAISEKENRAWPNLGKYADQADLYRRASWVYIAVSLKAQTAALVNFNVFRYQAEKKLGLVNHELEQLFRNPNGFQTQMEFMEATVGFLELTGNAYWYMVIDGNRVQQLLLLRPDNVRIMAGKDTNRPIDCYIYIVDGQEIRLEPEEVAHFTLFNPGSYFYGLSRLEAAALAAQTDMAAQQYNRNFFSEDKAIPAGYWNIKGQINQVRYEQAKGDIRREFGGTNRKTAIIRGGDIEYMDVGLSQKDMDFIAGRQFSKEEIFQIYQVPPGLLDKNATEANARAGLELFYDSAIWPLMIRLSQKVTLRVARPFYGEDLIVEPDDIRKKDGTEERAEMQAYSSILTINELRERYANVPPRPDGDIYPSGSGAAAITGMALGFDKIPPTTRQIPGDKQTQEEEAAAENEGKSLVWEGIPDVHVSRLMRRELEQFQRYASKGKDIEAFTFKTLPLGLAVAAKALADIDQLDLLTANDTDALKAFAPGDPFAKSKAKWERKLNQAVKDYFDDLQGRLIAAARHESRATKAGGIDDLLRRLEKYLSDSWWDDELENLDGAIRPIVHDIFYAAAVESAELEQMKTGITLDTAVFNTYAAKWADKYTDAVLKELNTTTQDGIGAIISRFIGQPDAKLSDLVTALNGTTLLADGRGRIVAVTETTRAFAAGQFGAATELAKTAGVDLAVGIDAYGNIVPAHPYCRCGVNTEFIYDDEGNIIGIDFRYFTANDALSDKCKICGPRDGLLVSEIVARGL